MNSDKIATVLVVHTGCTANPVPLETMSDTRANWVTLDCAAVLDVLRHDPFTVTVVVMSGDGESEVTLESISAIREASPRVPIVFLDEKESADSELQVRRAGVSYYAHVPANPSEISAVLAGFSGVPVRRSAHAELQPTG